MRDKKVAFEEDFTIIFQDNDCITDDIVRRFIDKYIQDHPNTRHGQNTSQILEYVRPIMINTPNMAGSFSVYPSIYQH